MGLGDQFSGLISERLEKGQGKCFPKKVVEMTAQGTLRLVLNASGIALDSGMSI